MVGAHRSRSGAAHTGENAASGVGRTIMDAPFVDRHYSDMSFATQRTTRDSTLWFVGPLVTVLLFLPVMRAAARLDRYHYSLPNHDGTRIRDHVGVFVAYGVALAVPSFISAVASKRVRAVSLTVGIITVLLACVCEAFVSLTTW